MTDVLVAEGLSRSFLVAGQEIPVVRRATLRIASNELVAILGRSGSGKSTLLAVCGGLDVPDTGWVMVAGTDVTQLSEEQRRAFLQTTVGWVFQAPQLVPLLSAAENVAVAMRSALVGWFCVCVPLGLLLYFVVLILLRLRRWPYLNGLENSA